MKLLSIGNPKILKGMKQGYMTYILHLAPANLSGYDCNPKSKQWQLDSPLIFDTPNTI